MDRLIEIYGTGRNLRNLIKYLSVTAVAGLAAAFGIVSHARLPDLGTVLLYAVLGFVGHHLVVAFPSGQFINLDDPVTFSALWCFGAPVAILASVPATLVQFFTRKRGFLNCLFNAGQLSLSTVAAGTMAGFLRSLPLAQSGIGEIIIALMTIVTYDVVNNAFVANAIAIDQEQTLATVFPRTTFYDRRNSIVLWYFVNVAGMLLTTYMGKAGTLFVFMGILALWAQLQFEREAARKSQEAQTDILTGLLNLRYLDDWMNKEFPRIAAQEGVCSLVFADVDGLKQINDTYGHEFGDAVLTHLGKVLKAITRADDRAVRYGGDEFILICQNAGLDEATGIGQRILEAIKKNPLIYEGRDLYYSVSMGVSTFPKHTVLSRDLVRMADKAMYLAKKNGGNTVYTADNL